VARDEREWMLADDYLWGVDLFRRRVGGTRGRNGCGSDASGTPAELLQR
jgi:hypothetical protein